ncbi:NTP transferase domain-containing protein [Halomarina litorea]|uniref:NTP transferase domain-containing protein n=1 Tax=Halomarina litorea TaxID=2961595 RepID=UPI0020C4FCEA|nr:NTP transferase domain-containing protein [Halomarina sp. BCD28]
MCGGRGTRLSLGTEKPLLSICGRAMVDRVLDALTDSDVERTVAAVSPNAPRTADHVRERVPTVETPGEGYVADLTHALDAGAVTRPALTVVADLPLLDGPTVDAVLAEYRERAMTGECALVVCVPLALKERLGVSADTTFERGGRALAPTGLNVVADAEDTIVTRDTYRLAVNVNRPRDTRVAEALCD